jgi:hypothetical protein
MPFLQVSINANSQDNDPICQRELKANHKFCPLLDYGHPASISEVGQMHEGDYGITVFVLTTTFPLVAHSRSTFLW